MKPAPSHSITYSEAILARADELIQVRRLEQFGRLCIVPQAVLSTLMRKLRALQCSVYQLDQLGEEVWDVRPDMLETRWRAIRGATEGLSPLYVEQGFSELRTYQDMEAMPRRGVPVSAVRIGEFYQAKTCDVRLARKLIADLGTSPVLSQLLEAWNVYDLVSEVGDDVLDVAEDSDTFNGNRFLSLAVTAGPRAAIAEYGAYTRALGEVAGATAVRCDHHAGLSQSYRLIAEHACAVENQIGSATSQLEAIVQRRTRAAA